MFNMIGWMAVGNAPNDNHRQTDFGYGSFSIVVNVLSHFSKEYSN